MSVQPDPIEAAAKLVGLPGSAHLCYYATALQRLTGLDVGEGQARILLGDLQAYRGQLSREAGHDVDERTAGQLSALMNRREPIPESWQPRPR